MVNKIMFETGLPDFIDERVEKIQAKLEKLNPEFLDMAEELEKIGWDLENSYKGLWESSNIRLQDKKYDFEKVARLSEWLKNFRVSPD
tara:strand:+ start:47 stop:310 length:264 start_codon:yes stop_codon:yes gene_type:complete